MKKTKSKPETAPQEKAGGDCPSAPCSASLSDAIKALNSTLKRHAEETSKELGIQMLKLEVTDLELQMLTLARKLKTAKEKLIAHYAEGNPQPQSMTIAERLERIQKHTLWNASKLTKEIGISRSTLYLGKAGTEMGARNMKKLSALEARLLIPLNAGLCDRDRS